jgi:hypothetical protein
MMPSGGQRCSAAQVAGDEIQPGEIAPQHPRRLLRGIVMADAVKAETPDALLVPRIWPWIDDGCLRHGAMKSGIKNGHLRHISHHLAHNAHPLQRRLVVRWCLRRERCDGCFHIRRYQRRLLVARAAMHHAMPHDSNGLTP